jgi:ribulose-phosphate 3-epimerase
VVITLNIKLAISILSANFCNLEEEIKSIVSADYLHLDVMDGLFVDNISFGSHVIKNIRSITNMIFDVHLMIQEPIRYIESFAYAGADIITVHKEACKDLSSTLREIKKFNKKVSVAINPDTPISDIIKYIDLVDMVLIMSVKPGFGGQQFIQSVLNKSIQLKKIKLHNKLNFDIEIDGGVNLNNIQTILKSSVNVIVVGSAILKFNDRAHIINKFLNEFESYKNYTKDK